MVAGLLHLSDEILLEVLGYLSSVDLLHVSQVNSRLCSLSTDRYVNQKLDFARETRLGPAASFKKFFNKSVCENLLELNISSLYWFPAKDLRFVTRCQNLQALDVSDTRLTNADIMHILQSLPSLNNLSFVWDLSSHFDSSYPNIKTLHLTLRTSKSKKNIIIKCLKNIFPNLTNLFVVATESDIYNQMCCSYKSRKCLGTINNCVFMMEDGSRSSNMSELNESIHISESILEGVVDKNITVPALLSMSHLQLRKVVVQLDFLFGVKDAVALFSQFVREVRNSVNTVELFESNNNIDRTGSMTSEVLVSLSNLDKLEKLVVRSRILAGKQFFPKLFQNCSKLHSLILELPSTGSSFPILQELSKAIAGSNLKQFSLNMKSWIVDDRHLIDALRLCNNLEFCVLMDTSKAVPRKLILKALSLLLASCNKLQFFLLETPAITQADSKLFRIKLNEVKKKKPYFIGCVGQQLSKILEDQEVPFCYRRFILENKSLASTLRK